MLQDGELSIINCFSLSESFAKIATEDGKPPFNISSLGASMPARWEGVAVVSDALRVCWQGVVFLKGI